MSNVIYVDFKKEREQIETLEKIKAKPVQSFDAMMGNPIEGIDNMIEGFKQRLTDKGSE